MKTSTASYGVDRTPRPLDTGYAAAADAWDRRMGLASASAARWQRAFFACLVACLLLAAGMLWAASRRQVELFVVEVDPAEARTIGVQLAGRSYEPDATAKAYFVADLVRNSRRRVLDPVAQNELVRKVYAFLAGPAETRMNEYMAGEGAAGLSGGGGRPVAREVEVAAVLQEADDRYQVRWTERTYAGGGLRETAHYTGLFTTVVEKPTDTEAILTNPIGLYVTDINWGRDFTASPSTAATAAEQASAR